MDIPGTYPDHIRTVLIDLSDEHPHAELASTQVNAIGAIDNVKIVVFTWHFVKLVAGTNVEGAKDGIALNCLDGSIVHRRGRWLRVESPIDSDADLKLVSCDADDETISLAWGKSDYVGVERVHPTLSRFNSANA